MQRNVQQWEEIDTPALLVDLDILDRNLRRTAELARRAGVRLRPHFKTHKSVWIAREQMRYGACGMTVAKLGEAELLADAGITDILVAYPIVGDIKLRRLAALLEKADVTVSIDDVLVAYGLSELGRALGKTTANRPVSKRKGSSARKRCWKAADSRSPRSASARRRLPSISESWQA